MWHIWKTGKMHTGFWWGEMRERDHLKDVGADGTIIIKWIFKTWDEEAWTELIWLGIGQMAGTREGSNKPSGSLKFGEILE